MDMKNLQGNWKKKLRMLNKDRLNQVIKLNRIEENMNTPEEDMFNQTEWKSPNNDMLPVNQFSNTQNTSELSPIRQPIRREPSIVPANVPIKQFEFSGAPSKIKTEHIKRHNLTSQQPRRKNLRITPNKSKRRAIKDQNTSSYFYNRNKST
mmetsp:Transcript_31909/g.28265  ORF Transcript_31909/g.28265 Transcript_31909/m.28265 type:complete len:151 (+) Transcript_31909:95-547(+)